MQVFAIRLGRKRTLLLGAIPLIVSWIIIGLANSVAWIYVSRILSGLSYGLGYSIMPMYLAEISSDRVRGSVSTLMSVMVKVGLLISYSVGPYVSFRVMAWISLTYPIVFVLTFWWLPESPYHLLAHKKRAEAAVSLARLRGQHGRRTDLVAAELDAMAESVRQSTECTATYRQLFVDYGRSLIIILGLGAVQQLSGSQTIIAYSQTIFERIGSDRVGGSAQASIVFGSVQVLTAMLSSAIIDRVGRRPLLLTSVIGAAICNAVVAIYFWVERYEGEAAVREWSWLPIVAIMIFICSYGIGMATATFTLLGEIFPKQLKAVAAATYMINTSVFQMVLTKLFQVVCDVAGIDWAFAGFAAFSMAFVPFVWFLIPETKGKSLDNILEEMRTKKSNISS